MERAGRVACVAVSLGVLLGACSVNDLEEDGVEEQPVTTAGSGVTGATLAMESGDVEADPGGSVEIYGRSATVLGHEQVAEFNEIDSEGYLVVEVEVTNTSQEEASYSRGDWTLLTPDGDRLGTIPVEGEVQISSGSFQPGESVAGQLIYAIGQRRGTFGVVFMPFEHRNDTEERRRGLWIVDLEG